MAEQGWSCSPGNQQSTKSHRQIRDYDGCKRPGHLGVRRLLGVEISAKISFTGGGKKSDLNGRSHGWDAETKSTSSLSTVNVLK